MAQIADTQQKVTITPFDGNGQRLTHEAFTVLFNPAAYSVSKTVAWTSASGRTARKLNAPTLRFDGGQSRTLTLELFYDVTEPVTRNGKLVTLDDVRVETNRMVRLTRIEKTLGHPPPVEVAWGTARSDNSDFPFRGVVNSLTQNFTLFSSDGRPLRATLTASFIEFLIKQQDQRKTDPELTSRVVQSGDRLEAIAARQYGDPAQWRVIARANGLDDPRRLATGRRLTIPAT